MRGIVLVAVLMLTIHSITGANAQALMAHIDVTMSANTWVYTLHNDEPSGNPDYISAFYLAINAPVSAVESPAAWQFQTDNQTYVEWYNTDGQLPYPHDIAPGSDLGGFIIHSPVASSYTEDAIVASWDHVNDMSGPAFAESVLAPAVPTAVPEPGVPLVVLSGILASRILIGNAARRLNCRRQGKRQT